MALSLNQLIKAANLSPDVKKRALENLDKMNEDQKFQLSQICWESIAAQYENKMQFEFDRLLEETANGKVHTPDEFAGLEDKMLTELFKDIQNLNAQGEIQSVKQELQKYLKNPPQKS